MNTITHLKYWKAQNMSKVLEVAKLKAFSTCADVVSLCEHRRNITEDKRWVDHFLWWADMRTQVKKKRLAADRQYRNFKANPRR